MIEKLKFPVNNVSVAEKINEIIDWINTQHSPTGFKAIKEMFKKILINSIILYSGLKVLNKFKVTYPTWKDALFRRNAIITYVDEKFKVKE